MVSNLIFGRKCQKVHSGAKECFPEQRKARNSPGEPPSDLRREEPMRVETAECSLARNERTLPKPSLVASEISPDKCISRSLAALSYLKLSLVS